MLVFANFRIYLDVESSGSNPFKMKMNWQGVSQASLILVPTIGHLSILMLQHLLLMVTHKKTHPTLGQQIMCSMHSVLMDKMKKILFLLTLLVARD